MCTETNIYCFDFIEKMYDVFYSPQEIELMRLKRVAYYVELITASPEWYNKIVKEAAVDQISVEEAVQKKCGIHGMARIF